MTNSQPRALIIEAIENDILHRKYNPMNEAAIQTAIDATTLFMQNKEERLKYLNREMAIID